MFSLNEHHINWRTLRVMKMYLLARVNNESGEGLALDGLVNLLDYIQDTANAETGIPETDIYTYEELNHDARELNLPYEEVDDAPFVVIDSKTGQWLDAFMQEYKAQHCVACLAHDGITGTEVITGGEWRARKDPDRVERP